ncbi:RHS repeat protein, partial [bacterium]|nr:RHS repeat protein [bacterium]
MKHNRWFGVNLFIGLIVVTTAAFGMPDIDLQKGIVTFTEVDLQVPGRAGLDISFGRTYNSRNYQSKAPSYDNIYKDRWDGWMGKGWSWSLANRLLVVSADPILGTPDSVTIEAGGTVSNFEWVDSDIAYHSKVPNNFSRVKKNGDKYTLETETGLRYEYAKKFYYEKNYRDKYDTWFTHIKYEEYYFVEGYYLSKIYDLNGNTIQIEYENFKETDKYGGDDVKLWSTDLPHGRSKILDRVGEFHPIRRVAEKLAKRKVNESASYWERMKVFLRDMEHEHWRPSAVTDSMGNQYTFEYRNAWGSPDRIKKIKSKGIDGTESVIEYSYEMETGLLKAVKKGAGLETVYAYNSYEPTFKEYRKDNGWGIRFQSVEYPDSNFLAPQEGWGVVMSNDMSRFNGWLLSSVTSPLGGITNYEYQDNVFRYLSSIDQIVWTQKSIVDLYTYPIIKTKTIKESEIDNGYTYSFNYTKDEDGYPLQNVFRYDEKYYEDGYVNRVFNKFIIGRSALFSWGHSNTYFRNLTITPPSHEEAKSYRWSKGLPTLEQSGPSEIITTYTEDYLPSRVRAIRGEQRVDTTYIDYDKYGNPGKIKKRTRAGGESTTLKMTYDKYYSLINNRLFHLVKTSVTEDDITKKQTAKTITTHSGKGQILKKEEQLNGQTRLKATFTYDQFGRVSTKEIPEQDGVRFNYDTRYYDGKLRVAVEQRVGTGASEKMTRSFLDKETGLPVYEQDSNGGETVFEYDEYHRLIKTIYPDGKEKTIEISDDLKTKIVESNGLTVKTKIDSLGRTLWIDNPEGLEDVAYTYTDLDRVSKVEKGILIGDTLSQSRIVEEFRYDTKGRVIEKILPDWGTTSMYFDDNLNKQTITDFAGRVSVKEYDDLNRLVKETINGVTKTYETDSLSSMNYVKDGRGLYHINEGHTGWEQTSYHSTTTLSNKIPKKQTLFKANGLVETSVISGRDGVSNTYTFDYDSLGRVSEIFQNDVSKESYNYGESNHGKSIGRLTTSENNDLTQSYTYDLTGRVTHEETTVKGPQQIISLDRGYNPKGKRDSTTYRDGKKLTYTYDSLNRIKTISYEETLIATYTYSLKGTVTDITYGNGVKNSYTYEKDVLVTEMKTTNPISGKEIKETYSYDNRGRLIEKTYPQLIKGTTKTRSYDYTTRDELKAVKEGTNTLYEYTY